MLSPSFYWKNRWSSPILSWKLNLCSYLVTFVLLSSFGASQSYLSLSVITIVYFAKIDITSLHCKWYYTFFFFSVVCRSTKKFHLVFLSCAEARKSLIWCFCRVQKREKVSFGVSVVCRSAKKFHLVFSVVCRSMKKFHLVFLSCAEARKSFIWCFWRVQKHEKVSFGVSDASRRIEIHFFRLQKVNF